MGMARYGHPINITELKIKVVEATQLHDTLFKDGIPGAGWVRLFRKRHPEISLCMSQGLDSRRAKGLCPENVSSFYENLEVMLARGYEASHIWNCNESSAQAGRNARVVLSNVLGGKDIIEGRDEQTNRQMCRIVIGCIRVKTELHSQIGFYILPLVNTVG
jgi:hypothetical protein